MAQLRHRNKIIRNNLRIIPVKSCRKYTKEYTGAGSVVKAPSGPGTPIAPAPASRPGSGRSDSLGRRKSRPSSQALTTTIGVILEAGIVLRRHRPGSDEIVTRTSHRGKLGHSKLKAHGGRPGGRLHRKRRMGGGQGPETPPPGTFRHRAACSYTSNPQEGNCTRWLSAWRSVGSARQTSNAAPR
jgi:hypothetical protein